MKLETPFKAEIIKLWREAKTFKYIFCIETEETEPGFPDVMGLREDPATASFYEFKVSDKRGKIKFTKDQPRFYALHKDMDISLIVYDNRKGSDCFYTCSIDKVRPFLKMGLEVTLDEIFNC